MRSWDKSGEAVSFKIKMRNLGNFQSPVGHSSKLVTIFFIPILIFIMVNYKVPWSRVQWLRWWNVKALFGFESSTYYVSEGKLLNLLVPQFIIRK